MRRSLPPMGRRAKRPQPVAVASDLASQTAQLTTEPIHCRTRQPALTIAPSPFPYPQTRQQSNTAAIVGHARNFAWPAHAGACAGFT
jgi:hypothetical protein